MSRSARAARTICSSVSRASCRGCQPSSVRARDVSMITGMAFGTATAAFAVIKRHYPLVIGTGGAVLVAMGVLIWTGEFTTLNVTVSNWLQSLGLPNFNGDT